jgi:hypothetical protein
MADSPAAAALIRRAAEYLRRDADLSARLGRSVMLNPAEVRELAGWLEFEARTLESGETRPGEPAADYAWRISRAYLHEAGEDA